MTRIAIEVVVGDALEFTADVLALKYAQDLYGVDRAVLDRLTRAFPNRPFPLPDEKSYRVYDTGSAIGASHVLFVGVGGLHTFDYHQIRVFGRRVLQSLARAESEVAHLALTIHGPGYGLDEIEAFESELAGLKDALASGYLSPGLQKITFVERDRGRAQRLQKALENLAPHGILTRPEQRPRGSVRGEERTPLKSADPAGPAKPLIFVAMPFHESMHDTFHYGIQGAVRAAGYICERSDQASFVGDVMEMVRRRISRASLVVADLTGSNPNVFLEVGFAWGCGRPTVLLHRDSPPDQFDVRGQKCLVYRSIQGLEEMLSRELAALAAEAH